jgi:hypothetical protein
MIAAEDLDLLQVLDKPHEVVDAIFSYYEYHGMQPGAEEQGILL